MAKIVCGSDLTPASAGALAVARALARQRGDDEVLLVHVVEGEDRDAGESIPRADIARSRKALEAQAAAIPADDGPGVHTELVLGDPGESLVGFAESEGADLIVIAARGTAGTGSLLRLGTTAEKVIARAHVPVIVIRDPAPFLAWANGERALRVLLGIDDSATCDLGIQWLQALRRMKGDVDVVLGAIYYADETAEKYGLPSRGMIERDPELEILIERDMVKRFGESDGTGVVSAVARRGLGRIGDHVVELAREAKVDAIVVGTSQKTGIGRLGSVSSIIIHDAPENVVCVPPNAQLRTNAVPPLRSALVATDLSPFANRAVPYAFTLTPNDGGTVHLAHVVKDDAQVDAVELARALTALVPVGATQHVESHVVRGDDAALAIAQTASRLGVDVICIASHGRKGLTRALMGSIADRVLRLTNLPVLVLRPTS